MKEKKVKSSGSKKEIFTGYKSEQFLSKFVPVSKNEIVSSVDKIKIKSPLVLKIMSQQALHKTEIGGIKFVNSESELKPKFEELVSIAKKKKIKLEGIMAQEFVEGEQMIIGLKKDNIFGHVIVFGLGGIFTEVLEDISIRKCPITLKDAEEMIDDLKSSKIFHGFRGKTLNTTLLKSILVKISQIPSKNKNIEEMDINPFILNEKIGKVVDARIVFS